MEHSSEKEDSYQAERWEQILLAIVWQCIFFLLIAIFFFLDYKRITVSLIALDTVILYTKFRSREEYQYCFPGSLARLMKKIPLETQYEGSLLGNFLIMISILLTTSYYAFFIDGTLMFKIFVIFNAVAGEVMLFFSMVSTYGQYVAYKIATKDFTEKDLKGGIN